MRLLFFFFLFQAEDGIRYIGVTGVQTCALPISFLRSHHAASRNSQESRSRNNGVVQIGRESCRERVEISVVAVSLKKKKKHDQTHCRRSGCLQTGVVALQRKQATV